MRPRRETSNDAPAREGFSKQELLEAAGVSAKVFDSLRKAARVRGPSHGGLTWVFSRDDVRALIHRARSGNFTDHGPGAAEAWERMMAGE